MFNSSTLGDELLNFLARDASSINERDENQDAPLHRVLREQRNEKTIKLLLERGADMNKLTEEGQSIFCIALSRGNFGVILKLMQAGCPMHSCAAHQSLVECFICSLQNIKLNADLLKLMIKESRGLDLNILDSDGRSLLCYTLSQFPGPDIVHIMLYFGCSWSACKYHESPWLCATNDPDLDHPPHLTSSLIQMLIDVEPEPNLDCVKYDPLLHRALNYCSYEISAIQLMLDNRVGQAGTRSLIGENALHAAVGYANRKIDPNIINFLVERGADINAVDILNYTPLHVAIKSYPMNNPYIEPKLSFDPSIIKALLENRASVNVVGLNSATPLWLAVNKGFDHITLQLLLNAGAKIYPGKWTSKELQLAMLEYKRRPTVLYISCCKQLIKYSLLDDPSIDIDPSIDEDRNFPNFVNECREEVQRMRSINIHPNYTLHQLIDRNPQPEMAAEVNKQATFDRVISVLVKNKFPVYFDLICATFGREDMQLKLQDIAGHLSNEELLKLIIASS